MTLLSKLVSSSDRDKSKKSKSPFSSSPDVKEAQARADTGDFNAGRRDTIQSLEGADDSLQPSASLSPRPSQDSSPLAARGGPDDRWRRSGSLGSSTGSLDASSSTSSASGSASQLAVPAPTNNFVPFSVFAQPPRACDLPDEEASSREKRRRSLTGVTSRPPERPSVQTTRMPSEILPQVTRTGRILPSTSQVREATIPCLGYATARATIADEDFGPPPDYHAAAGSIPMTAGNH